MKLFIFGSTGDLVKRKVLPSLQNLRKKDLEIWAMGRRDFTQEVYQDFVCDERCLKSFKSKINYCKIDFEKEDLCNPCLNLFDKSEKNFIYLALPPEVTYSVLKSLIKMKKSGFKISVLIEKPFGFDFQSALKLKRLLKENKFEKEIFLSDHYLFKKGVQKLHSKNFKEMEIVSLETLGLERRISYYNRIGALKDMIQSHFLNLVMKIGGMDVLKEVKVKKVILGQYEGYEKELKRSSKTETAVYLELEGKKKFIFITGKKFKKKETWIKIDGQKFELKSGGEYERIFKEFFDGNKKKFPTISDAIFSWKIIEKINAKKSQIKLYEQNSTIKDLIELGRI